MKKIMINILMRLLFRENFSKPYDTERRLRKLVVMNTSKETWEYLPQEYTRLIKQLALIPESQSELRVLTRGRIMQISTQLEDMESAEKDLITYKKQQKRIESMTKMRDSIKGTSVKYFTKIKF